METSRLSFLPRANNLDRPASRSTHAGGGNGTGMEVEYFRTSFVADGSNGIDDDEDVGIVVTSCVDCDTIREWPDGGGFVAVAC
jgi:hypothetical protein